ncbi:MAG: glycerol-3-phosphate 1-O-acyltransferase PlsY [Acidaminococcaceae bacterium]|nr:glycerol-3-phosphate 1-O-acyltransferase PlsY [Acidaminococcaceae bacterium]
MNYLLVIGGFLLGYVFGSIPCGLWLVQAFHGIDIRNYGSGNIGTTNVFRTVGPKTAAAVLIGDMLKGILALYIIAKFADDPSIVALTALGALLGHNYSLFLGFKGGKGVATGLGLFLYMLPWGAVAGFAVWSVIVLITRYVSLGSIVAAIVAAATGWYLQYPVPYAVFGMLACLFVIIRHKDNIKRLLDGTESKIKPGHMKDKN